MFSEAMLWHLSPGTAMYSPYQVCIQLASGAWAAQQTHRFLQQRNQVKCASHMMQAPCPHPGKMQKCRKQRQCTRLHQVVHVTCNVLQQMLFCCWQAAVSSQSETLPCPLVAIASLKLSCVLVHRHLPL